MKNSESFENLLALRDFFSAKNSNEIKIAYLSLVEDSISAPDVNNWQELEFAFNRFFVGPQAPHAPPFASVYLDIEPQLMSKSTMFIRDIYAILGLEAPMKNKVPDDHISYELDAIYQISIVLNKVPSKEMFAMKEYLMNEHLSIWLPLFINKVRQVDNVPDAFLYVVKHLENFVKDEISNLFNLAPQFIKPKEEI